ncbi:MAG: type II/IV secretion system ATPase subunit [Nanopusillaceae archaeon]|jgi:flagellar protein FlaI
MSDIYDFIDNILDVVRKKIEIKEKLKEKNINIKYFGVPSYSPINFVPPIKEETKKKRKKVKKEEVSLLEIPVSSQKKITEKDKLKFFIELYGKNENENQFKYPLTRMKIFGKEYIFAYADISWDEKYGELVYHVIEPIITENEKRIINDILDTLIKRVEMPTGLEKNFEKIKDYIIDEVMKIIKEKGYKIDKSRLPYILYYIIKDTIGYGIIDPLMNDPLIEDISCNGSNSPIYIFHRNPIIGEIKTNLQFNSDEELDNFVIKLSIRTGRIVSVSNPLLDAALPDGSRIQITYGKDISRKGSSFTIRKFTEDPFTPIDLLLYGTVDFNMLAYLWTLVEEGKSILVSGGTATGKTSFLNAISLFIKPEKKIISIEDTAELRLPHPNWLQEVARPGYGPNRYGEVTMFDLLKAALRQRPDYIIVGEVRGEEAYILFQAMATGHAGLGTIHAESFEALIDRLLSPPISLPPSLLEVLDSVIFLKRIRYKGKYVRRVDKIYEIMGFNKKKNDVDRIISYQWDPRDDSYIVKNSYVLKKIAEIRNWDKNDIETNFKFKIRVLEYLLENNIRNYRQIGEIMNLYYNNPDKLISLIGF